MVAASATALPLPRQKNRNHSQMGRNSVSMNQEGPKKKKKICMQIMLSSYLARFSLLIFSICLFIFRQVVYGIVAVLFVNATFFFLR